MLCSSTGSKLQQRLLINKDCSWNMYYNCELCPSCTVLLIVLCMFATPAGVFLLYVLFLLYPCYILLRWFLYNTHCPVFLCIGVCCCKRDLLNPPFTVTSMLSVSTAELTTICRRDGQCLAVKDRGWWPSEVYENSSPKTRRLPHTSNEWNDACYRCGEKKGHIQWRSQDFILTEAWGCARKARADFKIILINIHYYR